MSSSEEERLRARKWSPRDLPTYGAEWSPEIEAARNEGWLMGKRFLLRESAAARGVHDLPPGFVEDLAAEMMLNHFVPLHVRQPDLFRPPPFVPEPSKLQWRMATVPRWVFRPHLVFKL